MNEAAVLVRDCTFGYHKRPVLNRVSLAVERGQFVAVIGTNGAGKSTLLRLLLGELTPQAGTVSLFGVPVADFKDWRLLGYVPQNAAALAGGFPATAGEIVSTGLYARSGLLRLPPKEDKARLDSALAAVGMEDAKKTPIAELSGGQLQRVLLARAMAGEPRLLLLDEPTTGVDVAASRELFELLGELSRQQGLSVVMVTHDIARAADYIDCCYCLEEGSMVRLDREALEHELGHRHTHPEQGED